MGALRGPRPYPDLRRVPAECARRGFAALRLTSETTPIAGVGPGWSSRIIVSTYTDAAPSPAVTVVSRKAGTTIDA